MVIHDNVSPYSPGVVTQHKPNHCLVWFIMNSFYSPGNNADDTEDDTPYSETKSGFLGYYASLEMSAKARELEEEEVEEESQTSSKEKEETNKPESSTETQQQQAK